MERITSKSNQLIKDVRRLVTSAKERSEKQRFVLEGARLCFDVLNSAYAVDAFFITEAALEKYAAEASAVISSAKSSYIITEELALKLSDTKTTQGVFAVCKMETKPPAFTDKIIALECVQDPANMGAVFRTAEALGIQTLLTYRCCDIYNPKALRASMGGVLRLTPYECSSLLETLRALKKTHRIYATVPDCNAVRITDADFSRPAVCVIGNEANGISEEIKQLADSFITIPMQGNAESLNASVAAAITMWEMLR